MECEQASRDGRDSIADATSALRIQPFAYFPADLTAIQRPDGQQVEDAPAKVDPHEKVESCFGQGRNRRLVGKRERQVHQATEQEAGRRPGKGHRDPLPAARQGITADGQAAETVQDDVTRFSEQTPREDMA